MSISPLSDATPTRRASEGSAEGRISYSWQTARRGNSLMLNYAGEPQPLVPGSHEEFIAEHYWGYCRQQGGGTLEYHVEHPPWKIWPATSAHLDCDAAALYGSTLAAVLCEPPTSAFLADGSPVAVMQPVRIA